MDPGTVERVARAMREIDREDHPESGGRMDDRRYEGVVRAVLAALVRAGYRLTVAVDEEGDET
jgi:hypothetical protein